MVRGGRGEERSGGEGVAGAYTASGQSQSREEDHDPNDFRQGFLEARFPRIPGDEEFPHVVRGLEHLALVRELRVVPEGDERSQMRRIPARRNVMTNSGHDSVLDFAVPLRVFVVKGRQLFGVSRKETSQEMVKIDLDNIKNDNTERKNTKE